MTLRRPLLRRTRRFMFGVQSLKVPTTLTSPIAEGRVNLTLDRFGSRVTVMDTGLPIMFGDRGSELH